MKIVKYENEEYINNSDKCKVIEYLLNGYDIICGATIITERYPNSGYCVNKVCKK